MSRNISLLSGKKDDKNSLFGKISVSPNETTDAQLAGEYNLGVSTIHSTKSFEFSWCYQSTPKGNAIRRANHLNLLYYSDMQI